MLGGRGLRQPTQTKAHLTDETSCLRLVQLAANDCLGKLGRSLPLSNGQPVNAE